MVQRLSQFVKHILILNLRKNIVLRDNICLVLFVHGKYGRLYVYEENMHCIGPKLFYCTAGYISCLVKLFYIILYRILLFCSLLYILHYTPLFWAPILIRGGSVINRGYPV